MNQPEGVSEFMGDDYPTNLTRNHHLSTLFPPPASPTAPTSIRTTKFPDTIINDNEINVGKNVKHFFNFARHSQLCIVKIVAIGVFPIHAMHHRFTVGVGLDAEGFAPIAVYLHLIGKEGLNGANLILHSLHHIGTVRAVVR